MDIGFIVYEKATPESDIRQTMIMQEKMEQGLVLLSNHSFKAKLLLRSATEMEWIVL
jgi:hypothetical protein